MKSDLCGTKVIIVSIQDSDDDWDIQLESLEQMQEEQDQPDEVRWDEEVERLLEPVPAGQQGEPMDGGGSGGAPLLAPGRYGVRVC